MEQLKGTIATLLMLVCFTSFAQTEGYNPFKDYEKENKVLTLSDGRYNEFHDQDSIVLIGSAIFNTRTMKVVGLVEYDTLYSEATLEPNVVSRWLSPDPLAAKYPSMSPYNFVGNMPIIAIDPDGEKIVLVGTKEQRMKLLSTLQKLTNDRLVVDKLGVVRIASMGTKNPSEDLIVGTNLIRALNGKSEDDKTITIALVDHKTSVTAPINLSDSRNPAKGSDSNIELNLEDNANVWTQDADGNFQYEATSEETEASHELIHSLHNANGQNLSGEEAYEIPLKLLTTRARKGETINILGKSEEIKTVGLGKYIKSGEPTENNIRNEQGENKRVKY